MPKWKDLKALESEQNKMHYGGKSKLGKGEWYRMKFSISMAFNLKSFWPKEPEDRVS